MKLEKDPLFPDAVEQASLHDPKKLAKELKAKHSRRKRSPLKFVEFFRDADERLRIPTESGWHSVNRAFLIS